MMTGWPQISESLGPTIRIWKSAGPPAANGMMMRTGLTGYCWACDAKPSSAAASVTKNLIKCHHFPGIHHVVRVERALDRRHRRDRAGKLGLEEIDLAVADPVLAG